MSILFESEEGWIISHLDYLNKIYKTVEDKNEIKALKFNHKLFNVNSQYLRQNQIESLKKQTIESDSCVKKKKRKKGQILSEEIIKQNDFVKTQSSNILDKASRLNLFTNIISDNNQESRSESQKFYTDSLDTNCNYHGSNERKISVVADFKNSTYVFPEMSRFYCYDIREINSKFDLKNHFDLIILDPPWWNKSIRRKKIKFEESSYKMMYNHELAKIPVGNLLKCNGIVGVWCTNSSSQIKSILQEIFPAWNIIFKAKWYWLKITQTGLPICDFNDVHGKQPYEQIIFGTTTSNVNFNIPDERIVISIPSAVHSHKPPLTDIVKPYLRQNPKCMEIFARYLLPEWTSWGLEVLKFQHLSLFDATPETKNKFDDSDGKENSNSDKGNKNHVLNIIIIVMNKKYQLCTV